MKPIFKFRFVWLFASILFLFTWKSYGANRQFYQQYERIRISGPSMLPTLKSGEITLSYKVYPYRSLRIGDITVINSKRGYSVIHRISRRYRGGLWVTKGDNNRRADRELLGSNNFRGLALVDRSSIKRYRKLMNKNSDPIPADVEKYLGSRKG